MRTIKITDPAIRRSLEPTVWDWMTDETTGFRFESTCPYLTECQSLPHRKGLCKKNYRDCDFYQVYKEVDDREEHIKLTMGGR